MAERQFGPYRLIRQVAVGGMAEIHLAKTAGIAGFEKYVALKMIHPNFAEDEQFIQMLVDEAKIAVQLTHGNIAQTFDLGRVGETYYITMEYVDGADLYKILRRASEQDVEMPLDVCAFVGKEVASALEYAHRKRDHTGRPLHIVHRDVSPQNVLISYAGEVKLVDFGIAKATMKARQTAVGVIKGKYYYMSPEQAWGDQIDFRSDIFSAGIVLYEMLTGQMLYLEEDLHKLLDMARRAEIAPPTRLRRGIPPQLEKIVMHALQRVPGERYQSAADLATDLERFLHTYSPVFTHGKVSQLIKQVLGDPALVAAAPPSSHLASVPLDYSGVASVATLTIDDSELAHAEDRERLRDVNSVIFRIDDIQPSAPTTKQPRQSVQRPRQIHEETRQLSGVPTGLASSEDSGLVAPPRPTPPSVVPPPRQPEWDTGGVTEDLDHEIEDGGDRTVITAPTGGGYMMDVTGDGDGGEATMIGEPPAMTPHPDEIDPHRQRPLHARATQLASSSPFDDQQTDDQVEDHLAHRSQPVRFAHQDVDEGDGPTLTREPVVPAIASHRGPPPAALAARIHSPAVSELRKPRASRRTPPGGNVLQQIVSSQGNAPMPAPRPPAGPPAAASSIGTDDTLPPPMERPYGGPPPASPPPPHPFPSPPHGQPMQPPNMHPPGHNVAGYPIYPTPGSLYQMMAPPQPPSLTGQLRLFEVDEVPPQYRIKRDRRRWASFFVAGITAVSTAAIATFLIVRFTRSDGAPEVGSIVVESVPPGANVLYDNTRLAGTTPMTIDNVPLNTRHEIAVELARHETHAEWVDVRGNETRVSVKLAPITGRLVINTRPGGAEILIDGQLRGRTPTTVTDIDMGSAKKLEVRLKDYQPYVADLVWPANGVIKLDVPLTR